MILLRIFWKSAADRRAEGCNLSGKCRKSGLGGAAELESRFHKLLVLLGIFAEAKT